MRLLFAFCLCLLVAACAQEPHAPTGLMDVAERPAEKALLALKA